MPGLSDWIWGQLMDHTFILIITSSKYGPIQRFLLLGQITWVNWKMGDAVFLQILWFFL